MDYQVIRAGNSRSFPEHHPLAAGGKHSGELILIIGADAGYAYRRLAGTADRAAVLVELGTESLGTHTGEKRGEEGSNVLGFARFRLGDAAPSDLVELVRQPRTAQAAIDAARALFESHALKVALCG